MPHISLCCKLLKKLNNIDGSFKYAQLLKYLQDVSVIPLAVTPTLPTSPWYPVLAVLA
jgi:hypothetical protein